MVKMRSSIPSNPWQRPYQSRRLTKKQIIITTIALFCPIFLFTKRSISNSYDVSARKELTVKNDVHSSFEMTKTEFVEEYNADCTIYKHKQTGAEILSVDWESSGGEETKDEFGSPIEDEDDEKVFGIHFRTPPSDSTGIPHILEHSVLCGSRKYKTKEPFLDLMKSSLQTFLNAMTYPDRTVYLFSSRNTQDFLNLLNVYMDAVFFPRAANDPRVLEQEGWHLEPVMGQDLENMNARDVELAYQGVVFNEMRGVYSSPDNLVDRHSQHALFPNNTYNYDSGGDPKVIPELTFEQFKHFHSEFYHPTNSKLFVSGLEDVNEFLGTIDEYLSNFQEVRKRKTDSEVTWQQKTFDEPKREKWPYAGTNADAHYVMMTWLLNDEPLSSFQDLALVVLDYLLLGTSSSTLEKTMMESQLGTALIGGGLDDTLLQSTYSIGLKGVKKDNVNKVEQLVLDTLSDVANNGFLEEDMAAAMNTIEFQLREFNAGDSEKGINFMLSVMKKWIYDNEPIQALKFEADLTELKKSISESKSLVFQNLIRDLILNNRHRVTVELFPDETYESDQIKEEQGRIEKFKSELSDEQLQNIIHAAAELKKEQATPDSPEAIATIPTLTLKDLKKTNTEYPIHVQENAFDSGVTIVRHELKSTSEISYIDFGIDISKIPFSEIPVLQLFANMITETGTNELTDIDLDRQIGTHTGGLGLSFLINSVREELGSPNVVLDGSKFITKLFFRGKSLSHKADKLFDLYNLILTKANLNSKNKAIELLKERISGMQSSIPSRGSSYVNTRLRARYSTSGLISEAMQGISSLYSTKQLLGQAEDNWPALLERLESIRNTILDRSTCRRGMLINLTGDKDVLKTVETAVQNFVENLPGTPDGANPHNPYNSEHPWVSKARSQQFNNFSLKGEALVVPTQVNYVGQGSQIYATGKTVPGSTSVVSRYLQTGYLWNTVRVMNGAYGAHASFVPSEGFFSMVSYRDPHVAQTLDVYDSVPGELLNISKELRGDPKALELGIIATIGDWDGGVLSPAEKGWISLERWLRRESVTARQAWRQEILHTDVEAFDDFRERMERSKGSVAVVGSKDALERAVKAGKDLEMISVFESTS